MSVIVKKAVIAKSKSVIIVKKSSVNKIIKKNNKFSAIKKRNNYFGDYCDFSKMTSFTMCGLCQT